MARVASQSALEARSPPLGHVAHHLLVDRGLGHVRADHGLRAGRISSLAAGYGILLVFGLLMLSATAPQRSAEERCAAASTCCWRHRSRRDRSCWPSGGGRTGGCWSWRSCTVYVSVFLAGAVLDIPGWAINMPVCQGRGAPQRLGSNSRGVLRRAEFLGFPCRDRESRSRAGDVGGAG